MAQMIRTYFQALLIGLALAACSMIASVPSGALNLNVCDCGAVVYESLSGGGCPCVEDVDEGCEDDACGSCPTEPTGPTEPDDSCCSHVPVVDLHSGGIVGKLLDFDDDETITTPVMQMVGVAQRCTLVYATGPPPDGHGIRRVLRERRAIVLLI